MASCEGAGRKGNFDRNSTEKIFEKMKCVLGKRFSHATKCAQLERKASFAHAKSPLSESSCSAVAHHPSLLAGRSACRSSAIISKKGNVA
jgi:hypothetical protein